MSVVIIASNLTHPDRGLYPPSVAYQPHLGNKDHPEPPYNQSVTSLNQAAAQLPGQPRRCATNQTLLIDADDTLWENNIYFERAITSFISYLDHRVHTPEEVRGHLNRVEHATILSHGYGLHSFRRSLVTCFEQLTDVPLTEEKHRRIQSFAQSIADQEIELLPNVAPTLADLATRHRLILVTKGVPEEQTGKLQRSGLAPHFTAVEVLPEKHHKAYLSLAAHHATWSLEHELVHQPPAGQHLLELAAFADLARYF